MDYQHDSLSNSEYYFAIVVRFFPCLDDGRRSVSISNSLYFVSIFIVSSLLLSNLFPSSEQPPRPRNLALFKAMALIQ